MSGGLTYRLVRALGRMMLRSQYRRIEVVGAERVPAEGPVLLVANHFGSIVDPMGLLHATPRLVSFLAKAPLFEGALRPFLEAVEAVPVHRPEDEGQSVRANMAVFDACRKRLEAGACLALFPEGVSQPQPRLMPVRTGAARIVTDMTTPVTVVPVALVFEHRLSGERGTLLVLFGEPFVVNGTEGHPSRRQAIGAITRRIEGTLKDLLAEASSQGELDQLRALRTAWDQERRHPAPATLEEAHKRDRRFARWLAALRERAPRAVDEIRAGTDAWMRTLDLAGIPAWLLPGTYTAKRVLRFLLTEIPLFLVATPVALLAAVVTWPLRRGGDVLALRIYGGDEDVRAFCRMAGIGLLLALAMVVGGILAAVLWRPLGGLLVFAALPALLAFHVVWGDRGREIRARIRSFLLLAGGPLRKRLLERRAALVARVVELGEPLRREGTPTTYPSGEAT
jgi:1-acyl-sn-glycerol-3-phosphate acyltransferase